MTPRIGSAGPTRRRRAVVAVWLAFVPLATPFGAGAQVPRPKPEQAEAQRPTLVPQTPPAAAPLTKEDLEAFVDGALPLELQRGDIAGAVVTVVKDGKLLFAKGYGYSDVKRQTPVRVDATLFRIGSVSKTFTWTAVMQLVEQGKLDLDRDVNAYLDFKIPATFGKPVTMLNLMTHTPGFEEVAKDLFVSDSASLRPLGEWLQTHMPRQIYPPGTTPAYTNYGTTLAGYVVQRVSGTPVDQYIGKNILAPLGMTRATLAQPLPAELRPMMSKGYAEASEPEPKDFEVVQAWPAGSVSVTAEAMSRYMIAYLEDGGYGGVQILKPETKRLMFSRAFGSMPALPGMAHGFYEETRNGRRIVGHGGDTQWFHTDMHLMPDDHVGFFISYNSAGNGKADPRTSLWRGFLDRYFPYAPPAAERAADPLRDAQSVAGTYESSRRAEKTVMSGFYLTGQSKVTVNADTTISNGETDFAGNPKRFRQVAPGLYREVNGQDLVGFTKNYAGQTVMAFGSYPFMVGTTAPALKRATLNLTALGFAAGMFALTLLFWPVNAMLRRHYGHRPQLTPTYRRLRLLVRAACAVNLAFLLFWGWFLSKVTGDLASLTSGSDGMLRLAQLLGVLGVLGTVAAIYYAVRSWSDGSLWVWTKVWNTLLVIAFVGYTGFLLNWHLLSPSLRY